MLRRWAPILVALAVVTVAAACGNSKSTARRLDARALVAQPADVGGIRRVGGAWTELGDDGTYPLGDALGRKAAPGHIAFIAGYPGIAGPALGADVSALAVVLPDEAAADRLLRDSARVGLFVGTSGGVVLSSTDPPRAGDVALAGAGSGTLQDGSSGPTAAVAWTKGRLYGYVFATGPDARALATRIAAAQEERFERALDGDRLSADALLEPDAELVQSPFPREQGRTIHPTADVPRIDRPGRFTLHDLGVGTLTFSPAAGEDGVQFPVTLALPASPRGRWFWRLTTHVVVQLAPRARLGHIEVYPHVGNTSAPGAAFLLVRDLGKGRTLLIEDVEHTSSTASIEVIISAMAGGSASPRQLALVGFAYSYVGAKGALEKVTILPDSAIEVFDDPAQIGQSAITVSRSEARP